jgi:hypothetical protein
LGQPGYGEPVQALLPLRGGQPPDDAVVVIRGGVLSPQGAQRAATRSLRLFGVLGISIEATLGVSVLEACRTSERLSRYGHVQLSSFGRLRSAGFALLATFEHPHFDVVLRTFRTSPWPGCCGASTPRCPTRRARVAGNLVRRWLRPRSTWKSTSWT